MSREFECAECCKVELVEDIDPGLVEVPRGWITDSSAWTKSPTWFCSRDCVRHRRARIEHEREGLKIKHERQQYENEERRRRLTDMIQRHAAGFPTMSDGSAILVCVECGSIADAGRPLIEGLGWHANDWRCGECAGTR